MLVLARKLNERIILAVDGHVIVITAVDIRSDKVRLGIEADEYVLVDREEVWLAKLNEGQIDEHGRSLV